MPDLRDAAWYRCVQEIADMRASGQYDWAAATLGHLQRTIEATRVLKQWHLRTLERIRASEWAPGRTYDSAGYRRRWH